MQHILNNSNNNKKKFILTENSSSYLQVKRIKVELYVETKRDPFCLWVRPYISMTDPQLTVRLRVPLSRSLSSLSSLCMASHFNI